MYKMYVVSTKNKSMNLVGIDKQSLFTLLFTVYCNFSSLRIKIV